MSASFTIFVCSTFDDLVEEREEVLDAIRRVQQRHNAMEFFGDRTVQHNKQSAWTRIAKTISASSSAGSNTEASLPAMGISYSRAEDEEGVDARENPA